MNAPDGENRQHTCSAAPRASADWSSAEAPPLPTFHSRSEVSPALQAREASTGEKQQSKTGPVCPRRVDAGAVSAVESEAPSPEVLEAQPGLRQTTTVAS